MPNKPIETRQERMTNLVRGSIVILVVVAYLSSFSWFHTVLRTILIVISVGAGSYVSYFIWRKYQARKKRY